MKIEGQLKADELRMGRVTIDILREPPELSGLAALINTRSNMTIAWSKVRGQWSDETRDLAVKLRESMERDCHKAFFGGAGQDAASAGKGLQLKGGLAEHLAEDDAPSV